MASYVPRSRKCGNFDEVFKFIYYNNSSGIERTKYIFAEANYLPWFILVTLSFINNILEI